MCLKMRVQEKLPKRQRGIGLPATIFLIVIVSMIVVAMSELNENSALGFGQELNAMKAFYAAESGAQIGLNRVIHGNEACNNSLADIDFGATEGLSTCTVTLACSSLTVAGENYLTLISTASCGAGFEQAVRAIEVRAREG